MDIEKSKYFFYCLLQLQDCLCGTTTSDDRVSRFLLDLSIIFSWGRRKTFYHRSVPTGSEIPLQTGATSLKTSGIFGEPSGNGWHRLVKARQDRRRPAKADENVPRIQIFDPSRSEIRRSRDYRNAFFFGWSKKKEKKWFQNLERAAFVSSVVLGTLENSSSLKDLIREKKKIFSAASLRKAKTSFCLRSMLKRFVRRKEELFYLLLASFFPWFVRSFVRSLVRPFVRPSVHCLDSSPS